MLSTERETNTPQSPILHGDRVLLKDSLTGAFVYTKDNPTLAESDPTSLWLLDIRTVSLNPHVLAAIARLFWHTYPNVQRCQIGGMETSAIPLVAAIVLEGVRLHRSVTGFYVRKSRKKSGLFKQIEGTLNDAPIILVDDLINSGRSFLQQIELLRSLDKTVTSLFVLVQFSESITYSELIGNEITLNSLFSLGDFNLHYTPPSSPQGTFQLLHYFKSNHFTPMPVVKKSCPLYYNGMIYWGTDNGYVWCLGVDNVKVRWRTRLGIFKKQHVFATPVICGKSLFVGTYSGTVFVLQMTTGRVTTRLSVGGSITAEPLCLGEEIIIFGATDGLQGVITAVCAETHVALWQYSTQKPILATGTITGTGTFIIADAAGTFYAGNKNGIIKTYRNHSDGTPTGLITAADGALYWGTSHGSVCKTNHRMSKAQRIFSAETWFSSSPVLHKDILYISSLGKSVYALSLSTNTILWQFETKGRIFGSPVLSDNILYVGSNDARLYALDALTGQELGIFQATERFTSPVVVLPDKSLLATTFANELYHLSFSLNETLKNVPAQ